LLTVLDVLVAMLIKKTETQALPHPENERQWMVNDCWSCILGNVGAIGCTVINTELAAFIVKRGSETRTTQSSK